MSSIFHFAAGRLPVLISMPHNGESLAPEIADRMTGTGREVADTDWYMDQLYDFAGALGVSCINPIYSRYVIDLNRDPNGVNLYPGANSTELCPTTSFDSAPLYHEGKAPNEREIQDRITTYWQPYHDKIAQTLAQMKAEFGVAVLLEAHSIRSQVPRFFEGQLPDFNFGNGDGISCSIELLEQVLANDFAPYTKVANGRFKGGYITRHYGDPSNNIHALQLELSQHTYMKEPTNILDETKANAVKPKLEHIVNTLIAFAKHHQESL